MRPELEQIEKIEHYLNGELSPADLAIFEEQLAGDPGLRDDLKLHEDLRSGLERLTRIDAIKNAKQHYFQTTWLKRFSFGLGGIVIIGAIIFLAQRHHPAIQNNTRSETTQPTPGHATYSDTTLPASNEKGENRWTAADRTLKAQTFWLYTGHDTVIETKGGIVLSIPAHAFTENDHPVEGTIELAIKEALDPARIIRAGLSTRSGNRQLETGGMFFVDARQSGRPLTIDHARAIVADIPTDSIKPGMQLFTGNRLANGIIDWINPRPLEHNLVPIDIQSLNFYPPGYLDTLGNEGLNRSDKIFTDSLYYSLARFFAQAELHYSEGLVEPREVPPSTPRDSVPRDSSVTRRPKFTPRDTLIPQTACGINPAKIKAIWNTNFNNTLIATRQFEERLSYIHRSGDSSLLDLYIDHLDWDLSAIDSLASLRAHGEFKKVFHNFALRHDGRVLHGDTRFQQLSRYYHNRSVAYTEAVTKTQKEFWDEQAKLDDIASNKQDNHDNENYKREVGNFRQELKVNLDYAFTKLGYDTTTTPETTGRPVAAAFPVGTYTASIYTTGWCNVDRYIEEQTSNRQTIDFTDANTGKRAVINYREVSFHVRAYHSYDRVTTYLLPDKVSSFMRLDADSNNTFTEKLNSLMSYRLVIIGYKQETAYYYMLTDVQPAVHRDIPLTAVDKATLDQRLNSFAVKSQSTSLIAEQNFVLFSISDQRRQRHNRNLLDLTDKLLNAFFPCSPQKAVELESPPGEALFVINCAQCHAVRRTLIGPALAWVTAHRDPVWLHKAVKNYHALMLSGDCLSNAISDAFNKMPMPVYPDLSDKDTDSILSYISDKSRGIDSNAIADYKRKYPQCQPQ